jgi:hypothetical protein
MLEGGLTWLNTLSIAADPDRHAGHQRVFRAALGQLEDRLHRHRHHRPAHDGRAHRLD